MDNMRQPVILSPYLVEGVEIGPRRPLRPPPAQSSMGWMPVSRLPYLGLFGGNVFGESER
jgi:hypothetical protein